MRSYSITLKTHFANASGSLIYLIAIPIVLTYEYVSHNFDDFLIAIIMFGALGLFHIGISLLIHLNYYFANKQFIFELHGNECLLIDKNIQTVVFNINDIVRATAYKSFALHKGNIQLLSWDSYNHMIIELNNGTKIVLTSLLMGVNNPLPIPEEKIIVKMNFFRWVGGTSIKLPDQI